MIILIYQHWSILPDPFSPGVLLVWLSLNCRDDDAWPVLFWSLLDFKVLIDVLHAAPGQQIVSCCKVERCLGIIEAILAFLTAKFHLVFAGRIFKPVLFTPGSTAKVIFCYYSNVLSPNNF